MLNSIKAKQYFLILLPVLFLLLSNVSKCEYQVYYCGLREALLSAVLRSKGDPITVQYLVTVSTHLAVLLWYCSSHGSSLQSCPVLKSVSNFVVHHFRIAIIPHWWAQIRQHCILQRNCIGSTLNFVWDEALSFILSLISLSGTYRSPPEPVLSHQDCLRILRLVFHILIFFFSYPLLREYCWYPVEGRAGSLSWLCSIPCVTERPPGDTTPPSASAFTVLFLGSGFACSLPWGTFCLQSSWGNSCSHPECRAQYCVFKP